MSMILTFQLVSVLILPEWNVNNALSCRVNSFRVVLILPEWNVNVVTRFLSVFAFQVLILPEWNVN